MSQALTVTALNHYIKTLMDRDEVLSSVVVSGELSNYKVYPSGHHYFSLKDKESSLRCVMFRGSVSRLKFEPRHGMAVLLYGSVSVFPRDGQYQLYVTHMTPDGAGDLHVAFEQLKEKLAGEGLFDLEHKKPLPKFPKTIALVTSGAGAAVRDMIRILGERYPAAQVVVLPVSVQGERAPAEIAGAIGYANTWRVADILITGRGGGSLEDLWAFNDERVARAIFDSTIPVISAVGHEPDVTISDYVADVRASTPSNAAELAVPDQQELARRLQDRRDELHRLMQQRLSRQRERLDTLARNRHLTDPMVYLADKELYLDRQRERLERGVMTAQNAAAHRLSRAAALLDSLSPLKVLARGYTLVQQPDGTAVRSVKSLKPGDSLQLTLQDGIVKTTVEGTVPHGKRKKADF